MFDILAAPMMAEVLALAMEGVEAERLDKSLKKFGWPVGAITLADEVGIDVAGHVHSFLSQVCSHSPGFVVKPLSQSCLIDSVVE